MRILLALLLPNLLLTPALCVAHAGEHDGRCAPHFHTHQLPFGFPEHDDEDDHDADAVPAPQLTAPAGEQPVTLDLATDAQPLAAVPVPVVAQSNEVVFADTPPPPKRPLYLTSLTLRL